MALAEIEAIEKSIELWEFCAETGESKDRWSGWNRYTHRPPHDCFLCEYAGKSWGTDNCELCPYYKKFHGSCFKGNRIYGKWEEAFMKDDTETMKKYAIKFLKQLKALK